MRMLAFGFILSSILLAPLTASARTWVILVGGGGDAPTIQAGIDSAAVGDTVLLECGIFREHDIHMKSGIYLTSVLGNPECTTIDAEGLGRVMYCVSVEEPATINGLTFKGGVTPLAPPDSCRGGGMYISESSITVTDSRFVGNQAKSTPPSCNGYGGAVYAFRSSVTFVNCTFSANSACYGGGMLNYGSNAVLEDCIFSENGVVFNGGGLASGSTWIWYPTSLVLTGCLFLRNSAEEFGGGLIAGDDCSIRNSTFSGNSATEGGGIFWGSNGGALDLVNTIIAFSPQGQSIYCSARDMIRVSCCDSYGNRGGDWTGCLSSRIGTSGNFSLDPLFCDAANDEYTLMQCSSCAPGNHPEGLDCGLIGALPVGCVGTPVERTTWGHIKTLFR